jgi:signal transduction histidine kinase/ActR/RegA family two-component response regulator
MSKLSLASAHSTLRALTQGGLESSDLRDEALALRQLLLELRADLPSEREPGRESNRARFAEALAALGELAITTEDVDLLCGAACDLTRETLDVDAVALLEERPDGSLVAQATNGTLSELTGQVISSGPGTQAGFALAQRASTATADARAAWGKDPFLAQYSVVAAALAVLPGFAAPRALLGAYGHRRRSFAPDEVRFLEAAASSISAALGRRRAERERLELHSRLAIADRLVSVGTLAAGVAHELNNPLAYVNANLSFLAEQVKQLMSLVPSEARGEAVSETLTQIEDAARDARDGVERMCLIVRDLKTLSRADDGKVGPVDLVPVVETCLNVAQNEIKHRATLVRDLGATPAVRGSEARLGQVILNLLINAAQAIPEGHPERHQIHVRSGLEPDGAVFVSVEDTGCGIDPEQRARIFDPFFTTKPPGVGTGLGLSICHGIVSTLGGRIDVESAPGLGSTFKVVLPAMTREPADDEHGPPGGPTRAAAAPRPRILVVDDEPLVRTVIQRTLGSRHEVVACGSVDEALERVRRGEEFHLVLSDLLMPERTGMDLFHELEHLAPALAARMVFLSGGACTEQTREFLERPGRECVEKPFQLESFRALVARRLAEVGAPAR